MHLSFSGFGRSVRIVENHWVLIRTFEKSASFPASKASKALHVCNHPPPQTILQPQHARNNQRVSMSVELSGLWKMPVNFNLGVICLFIVSWISTISTWHLPWDTRPSSVPLRHDSNATQSSISRPARRSFCSKRRDKQHQHHAKNDWQKQM